MAPRSFDRIADRYDETRGGDERGGASASVVARFVPAGAPVLELGVGTGLVAAAMPPNVVGVDIAPQMLSLAVERLGARLVCADASRLPFPAGSFDGAYAVWLLHLVEEQEALFDEAARVLRSGAAFVIEPAAFYEDETDDVQLIVQAIYDAVVSTPRRDTVEMLTTGATRAGFAVEDVVVTTVPFKQSPTETADAIDSRAGAAFWDLSDQEWNEKVAPRVAAIRALTAPDVQRDREMVVRHVVFRR